MTTIEFDGAEPYISGPMTGYTDFNFPMFDACERDLRLLGCGEVFSPANHDRTVIKEVWGDNAHPEDFPGYAVGDVGGYFDAVTSKGKFSLETMFQWDLDVITNHATHLVMLPGWQVSTGARYERTAAEALSKPIVLAVKQTADDGVLAHTKSGLYYVLDPEQKRMTEFLRGFNA